MRLAATSDCAINLRMMLLFQTGDEVPQLKRPSQPTFRPQQYHRSARHRKRGSKKENNCMPNGSQAIASAPLLFFPVRSSCLSCLLIVVSISTFGSVTLRYILLEQDVATATEGRLPQRTRRDQLNPGLLLRPVPCGSVQQPNKERGRAHALWLLLPLVMAAREADAVHAFMSAVSFRLSHRVLVEIPMRK